MIDPLPFMEETPGDGAERIHLPDGLLGFEGCHNFVLEHSDDLDPFLSLHSEDDPGVAFVVAPPDLFYKGEYLPGLSSEDRGVLQLGPDDTSECLVIVTVSADGQEVTANLKGPVVFNPRCSIAKQVVVYNPSFSLRAPLLSPGARVDALRREA